MSTVTPDTDSPGYSLRTGWRTLALAGGIVALLGVVAMAFPFVSGISVAIGLAAVFLVAAVVHAAHAFTARGWRGRLWQLTLAAITAVAAVVLLANPVLGLVSLTILLVAYLLVDGATELWMAARMAGESGRAGIAASGALSLVLAAMLWIGFPADAAWAIGLLVGVSLFVTGLSMAFVAYAGRAVDDVASAPGQPRGA